MLDVSLRNTASAILASLLAACGGGGDSSPIVNEQRTIAEGVQVSYALPAGSYKATVTASSNGVVVSWPGGSGCTSSFETKSYTGTCTMPSTGQLVVQNPTLLGLGGDEIVTINVTQN